MIDEHDDRELYCRMLGHDVRFSYCRAVPTTAAAGGDADGTASTPQPCRRIADCWFTQFDVVAWLREHYSAEQIDRLTAPPPPKIASLLDLIEKARAARD